MPGGGPRPYHPKSDDEVWKAPPDPAALRELARRLDAFAFKLKNVRDSIKYAVSTTGWWGSGYNATMRAGLAVSAVLDRVASAYREFATSVRQLADEAEKHWAELKKQSYLKMFSLLVDVVTIFLPLGKILSSMVNGLSRAFTWIATRLGTVMPKGAVVQFVFGQVAMLPVSLAIWGTPELLASSLTNNWAFEPVAFGVVFGLGAVFAHPFFWRGPKAGAGGATDVANVGGVSGQRTSTGSTTSSVISNQPSLIKTIEGTGLGIVPRNLDSNGVSPLTSRPSTAGSTVAPGEISARTPSPVPDAASAGGPPAAGAASSKALAGHPDQVAVPPPVVGPRGAGRGPSVEHTPDPVVPPSRPGTPSLFEATPPGGTVAPPGIARDIAPPPAATSRGEPAVTHPAEGSGAVPRLPVGRGGEPVPPTLRMEPPPPGTGERWVQPPDVSAGGGPRGGAVDLPGVGHGGAGAGSVPRVGAGAPVPQLPGVRDVVPAGVGEQALPPVGRLAGGGPRGGAVDLPGVGHDGAGAGAGSVPRVGAGVPVPRLPEPAHLGAAPPNVRAAAPSPHGGPDEAASLAPGAPGRRQVDVSLSPGHELSAADSRAIGKLPSNGSVAIRGGEGQFPASSLPNLRQTIWAGTEGELVVRASRVKGLPTDPSVVPTLRGRPVPAAEADEFRVFGSEAQARSAHPTWSPTALRAGSSSVTSVGEASVAAGQAAGVRPPTRELPGEPVSVPHDGSRLPSPTQRPVPDADSGRPASTNLGDPAGTDPARAASAEWTRLPDGLHETRDGGALRLGSGDTEPGLVDVPPGSRAVFDGAGELRLVIRPDGLSFDRDLVGAWSARTERGEITVSRLTMPEQLTLADGRTITLRSGDQVRHEITNEVVAYRVGRGADAVDGLGPQGSGNTFLRMGDGRWSVADIRLPEFQGWLAAANKAPQAARELFAIAERYGPRVAPGRRLNELDDVAIGGLLRSDQGDDVTAAVYEVIRRHTGMEMRWTQADAVDGLTTIAVVNMAAGEGKSLAYHAAVGRLAFRGEAVQYISTRDNLAARDAQALRGMYEPYGAKIHRMNEEGNVPTPVPGEPTIYVGTHNDIGFSYLGDKPIPGRTAVMDEIDEALVFDDTLFQHSTGVGNPAAKAVVGQVVWARDFLNSHRAGGSLTADDFNLGPGRRGAPGLTEEGLAKVERILGRAPSEWQQKRLNLSALAEFHYRYKTHYTLDEHGKVVIINQTTHRVLKDLGASTERFGRETRWNDGLAQAIEAKHNLPIRADADTLKKVSAGEIYSSKNYDVVVGASGTALGKEVQFAQQGLSGKIRDVPRYFKSKLIEGNDLVFATTDEKLGELVAHAARDAAAGRPQWIIAHDNALVSKLSDMFKAKAVDHTAVDADWFLKHGPRAEAAFQRVVDEGGQVGKITVVNLQGARGVDVPISASVAKLGGLDVKVTARSAISHDIDIQAMNRAARSGQPGRAQFYTSLDDDLLVNANSPRATVTITRYEIAKQANQDLPTLWSAADLKQAEADVRALVPVLQAEAQERFLASITPTPRPTVADPVPTPVPTAHAGTPARPSVDVTTPAEHPAAVPADGTQPPASARNAVPGGLTPPAVEGMLRPSGAAPIDPAVQLSALRAAAQAGAGLEIRQLADQPGYALTRNGGVDQIRAASGLAFGQRSVLVVNPGVSGAGDTAEVTDFLDRLPDAHREATLIDVGAGPRVPVDVVQGWADQGWTGPGGTAPIIVGVDRLDEAPNSKWFVPYVDTSNLRGPTSDQFARYFLVYPSTGPVPGATPHNLPASGLANQFELGQGWVLDTARPGAALVSPPAAGPGQPPSRPLTGGPPGSNRLEVTGSATMPPEVKAQVHRLLSGLPPTVDLVVDGRSGRGLASWLADLELAALAQRMPSGYRAEPVPAGYVVGRDGARFAGLESARTMPRLTDSVVMFLDPSIGNTDAVTDILTAAHVTVRGRVVAHLNPPTPVDPVRAANTAGELRQRAGVSVLIAAGDLAGPPAPNQFVPIGSVTGHYLVLPSPQGRSPASATSDTGSVSGAASVTDGTSVTAPSSYGDMEPADGVSAAEIPSGFFLHGPVRSAADLNAASALPTSILGTRVVPDALLFADLGSLAAAVESRRATNAPIFIDLRFAGAQRTPEWLTGIAEILGAPVLVDGELAELAPAHSIGLDAEGRPLQGSGVAAAFLVRPQADARGWSVNRPRSTDLARLRVWRDHLQAKVDEGLAEAGPSAGNVQATWRAFSETVGNAALRAGADDEAAQAEVATAVRAYVDASAQLPTQLSVLPTVAQVLGVAPALSPLPATTGADGRFVAGALGKALNALALVPDADVRGAAFDWNRWVSSVDPTADRLEILKAATVRITDVFLAARPADDPASVRDAAVYLAGRGAIKTALGYLAEPDPSRRRRIVRAAVPEADADLLKALGDLSRGTAKLPSEKADVNMITTVANALVRPADVPDLHDTSAMAAAVDSLREPVPADVPDLHDTSAKAAALDSLREPVPGTPTAGIDWVFDPNREMAAALGISREFVPRYLTDAERVEWIDIINSLIARHPSLANTLRVIAVATVDC
ncbi:hypothetical protein [Micromonospora sp. NPDC023814]|uniref:preprotein translocase subunit SecA n=1 Tax=Micromonospora sp. NPDC023814 TaxID=3154596 RepID=UPI0033C5A811